MTVPKGTYRQLRQRWEALHARDLRLREIACGSTGRSLLCADMGDPRLPAIAIAAGLHGDEPAGPWALLELLEGDALDSSFSYRIWPCINVTGFDARTRESAQGVDLNRTFSGDGESPEACAVLETNRDRKFALSLDLHEDCDATGFYCYEYGGGRLGRRVIAALDAHGFAIDPLESTFDLAGPLRDAHCRRERGRVVPDSLQEALSLGGLSYSLATAAGSARQALTFETPSASAWAVRGAMHQTAVRAAIAALAEESFSKPFK